MKQHIFSFTYLILSVFFFNSCREYEFTNPVDSVVGLRPPEKLTVTAYTDSSVTFSFEDPNPEPQSGAVKKLAVEVSENSTTFREAGNVTYSEKSGILFGNFGLDTTHIFRAYTIYGENRSANPSTSVSKLFASAPTDLEINFAGDTLAHLTWKDNCQFEKGFEIERSTDDVNYTTATSTGANITSTSTMGDYRVGTTYYFRVKAVTNRNKSAATVNAKQIVFNAPSAVTANFVSDTAITISWTDNSTIETGFELEQSTDNVNFAKVGTAPQNTTSKTIDGAYLLPNTYYFRVRAVTPRNSSPYSQIVSKQLVFNAPSNVAASFLADSGVTIAWTDNSTIETGFEIEQSMDNVNFAKIGAVFMNATSKTIEGAYLLANTYYFRVRAVTPRNSSPYSQIVSKQLVFNAPSNVAASFLADSGVTITWTDNSSIETGFEIEQSTDNLSFAKIGTAFMNATSKTIEGAYLVANTYYFRVRAITPRNASAFSQPVSNQLIFNAPSNVTATFSADSAVTITWTDNSAIETGFDIEQSTDNVNFTIIGTAVHNVTGKTIVTAYFLANTYYIRVCAKSKNNGTVVSAPIQKQLQFNPPSNTTATFSADSAVIITWMDNSTIETGFEIEQSTDNVNFVKVGTVAQNATSKMIEGAYLVANIYYFRVRAITPRNASAYSPVILKQIIFSSPNAVNAVIESDSAVTISWSDNSNFETGFEIEQSTDNVIFVNVGIAAQNATSQSIEGAYFVTNTYFFRIRAVSKYNSSVSTPVQKQLSFSSPSDLVINSLTSTFVKLEWQDNSNMETGFEVYHSLDGISYTLLSLQPANITSATIQGAFVIDTTYAFKVRAKSKHNGHSGYSGVAQQFLFVCGTSTVSYAGKSYSTVQVGNQCWLKKNLDVGAMILGSANPTNSAMIEKYCYGDNLENCDTYGGLYQWNEAMGYTTTAGAQGICPLKWHIPTSADLQTLSNSVSGNSNALKAVGQGAGNGAGTNSSGFSALLTGYRNSNGSFSDINTLSLTWSSSKYDSSTAIGMDLYYNDSNINTSYYFNTQLGMSVRCVKD